MANSNEENSMDYEKKYNEALSQARFYYGNCPTEPEKKKLEKLFPELRESEDERIRNAIFNCLYQCCDTGFISRAQRDDALAWLEKQKENPKSVDSISSDCASDAKCEDRHNKPGDFIFELRQIISRHWWADEHSDRIEDKEGMAKEILELCEKQKEQKPADDKAFEEWIDGWFKEHKEKAYPQITMDEKEFKSFCRGIRNMYQQKPAEWSEEDKAMRDNILRVLSCFVGTAECESNPSLSTSYPLYRREIDWLKSLRLDLKKKNEDVAKLCSNEWSEEDGNKLNHILEIVHIASGTEASVNEKEELESFLKSLRPQPKQEWNEEDEENFKWFDKFFRAESIVLGGRDIPQDKYLWFKSLRPQPKQEVVDRTVFDRIADILRWCNLPIGCPVENFKESESEREHLLDIVQCVAHRYANSCTYCKEYSRGYQDGLAVPHWKPSEEQMEALKVTLEYMPDTFKPRCTLMTLQNDLEKLI